MDYALFPFSTAHSDDFVVGVAEYFRTLAEKTARDIMDEEPCFVAETTPLSDVAKILKREMINELPVVDQEGHVIGQVNVYEIISAYLHEIRENSGVGSSSAEPERR